MPISSSGQQRLVSHFGSNITPQKRTAEATLFLKLNPAT
ncbi:hypothetical protein ABI_25390 [Asticcacaulis biprosthecium C19]|uniref:Uncharacterized protein n=1 Tax=Asticcacaulis biprosthecium C19 TaxID=715226 RepID=F4QP67_9CAUL|nr:hypothetical protein ABI_25390 [Asticcacaulis biprosthecium C19]